MTEMTRYALRSDGAWLGLAPGALLPKGNRNAGGDWEPVQFNAAWADSLSPEALVERDLALVIEGPLPVGAKATTWTLDDVDGAPVRTWGSEAFGPEELAAIRAQCVLDVKAEARRRILAVMNKDEQDNALALGQEMIFLHGPDPTTWPQPVRDEYLAVMAKWSQINVLRAASDLIEAALPDDAEALCAFNAAAAGWPA